MHEAQHLFQGSIHPLIKTSALCPALLYSVPHYGLNLTYKVLPLGVQVSLVGQAALHDVGTVVGAGFDGGHAAAVGAVNQLHQGLRTLWTKRNLGRFDRTVSATNLRASSERRTFMRNDEEYVYTWSYFFFLPLITLLWWSPFP